MDCNRTEQLKVGNVSIWQLEGQNDFFFYKAGMAIDVDGAPRAYHPEPDSDLGLDNLANAGGPGHWFAIVTDNGQPDGNPIIQRPNDPAPGFYVSSTSLQDKTKDRTDPLRYVDATQIPYIVLPPEVKDKFPVRLGDFAVVINSDSGHYSGAIFADVGPEGKIGEGSIALADNLGIPSNPKHGGTDSGVVYVVFLGSGDTNPRSLDEIKDSSNVFFDLLYGGMAQLQACFPELRHRPTVTGIEPTSAPSRSPMNVTITGWGFTGAIGVSFGSMALETNEFSVFSDTEIDAITPNPPTDDFSGTVHVTVTNPIGTSAPSGADQFTFYPNRGLDER